MANVPNAGLNIVQDDYTAAIANTNIYQDTGVLNIQNGAFLTNDRAATNIDPTDGDATNYENAILIADAITAAASGTGGGAGSLAILQEEKLDLRDFTLLLTSTGSDSGNSSPLVSTVRLADGDVVFTGNALVDFGGHTDGTNLNGGQTETFYDNNSRFIPIYDSVRFLNQVTSNDGARMSFRGAHPVQSSLNNVFFDSGINALFNAGITQHGASFGGSNTEIITITDGDGTGSVPAADWTPWTSLDTSEANNTNAYFRINGGVRWVLVAPLLNGSGIRVRANNGQNSRIEFFTPWQPNFTRADNRASTATSVRFANSLTILPSQTGETYTYGGYPTASTTTGVLDSVTNGQLYVIQEGAFDISGTNQNIRSTTAAERAFRHYAYELNLDSQALTIGSYTSINRAGSEVTRYGTPLTGFLDADDTVYELPVDLLADASTLADAIATTFVVDNTDKLYQGIKARYVADQTDVDWSEIANTPTGSSIDLGDDDITWVDGTTEAIAIDGASHNITVTTDTIGTLSNGAFTNEIVTTGTVALTGTSLTNVDIDAGDITGYGDLVNSNLTSDAAIILSSSVSYGGATLTSTLNSAVNFTSVPDDLSNVTLVGSNDEIAIIGGSSASTFENVTWDGVVDFRDTGDNIVHQFTNVEFTSLPTNDDGGGVDFRLGPDDTIMSTFGQATAPAGFTLIRADKDIVITIPSSVTQPVFYKSYINGVAQADPASSLSAGVNTITIDEGDIGNNAIDITFTGADIIEQTISGAYADNIDTALTLNPFFSTSTATVFTTSLTGNVFRIIVPSNDQSIGSAGVHNASAFTAKSTQNYANYMALANQSDVDGRITSTATNNVIYYTDGTFETKLMVTDGGSVSDINLGGAFWRTSFGGTPFSFAAGDDDGNSENFNEAIVDGLTIFTTPTSGAAATTEANVLFTSVSEDTTDYSTLRVVVDASIAASNGLSADDFYNTNYVKGGPLLIPQRPTN